MGNLNRRPPEMDELLERIWTEGEKGKTLIADVLRETPIPKGEHWLSELEKTGFVQKKGDSIHLTPKGEIEAGQIIRRHRLTERLFADVFQTSEEVWEQEACELEHGTVLVEEATNAVCSFLGHPPTCPHGRAIPKGPCCVELRKNLRPFVIPLFDGHLSEFYRIVFIGSKKPLPLDRLSTFGIFAGRSVKLLQKLPSCVLLVDQTEVAIDPEIAKNIYVKRQSSV